ncbi:MAG TPA: hypothetical protein VL335_02515 [Candidatus Paceibacterota bacterium]|jgi:hypothetical protein|nr:hypothetical protein [Candidatus Paceibacterota bacterium]
MSNIEFDGDNQGAQGHLLYARFQASAKKPSIVSFLINKNIVKNENQANVFLLILIGVFIVGAVILYHSFNYQNGLITPEEFIQSKSIQ